MTFVPGIELCRRFHDEVVQPILGARFPSLRYAAARVDHGSELLGFDTERSTDHDWGPRLQVFVDDADLPVAPAVDAVLHAELPPTFLGYPTTYSGGPETGRGRLDPHGDRHGVQVIGLAGWLAAKLGFDARAGVATADWLSLPTQILAELTGGGVFRDDQGELTAVRAALRWYPEDVHRYVLAAGWARVGQEEHLVGRAAQVGDELGSALLAGRLANDLVRQCLLLARRYPPYGKWLGSAFARLPDPEDLGATLRRVVSATDWPTREDALCRAYGVVARRQNASGLAPPLDPAVRPFHDRPFRVLDAGRFERALLDGVRDPLLRRLVPVGAIDQYVDSTDVLGHAGRSRAAALAVTGAARRIRGA